MQYYFFSKLCSIAPFNLYPERKLSIIYSLWNNHNFYLFSKQSSNKICIIAHLPFLIIFFQIITENVSFFYLIKYTNSAVLSFYGLSGSSNASIFPICKEYKVLKNYLLHEWWKNAFSIFSNLHLINIRIKKLYLIN